MSNFDVHGWQTQVTYTQVFTMNYSSPLALGMNMFRNGAECNILVGTQPGISGAISGWCKGAMQANGCRAEMFNVLRNFNFNVVLM